MNESRTLDRHTPDPGSAPTTRNLPRLRFPILCLLIFWVLSFVVAHLYKPDCLGSMYGLSSTALRSLLFLFWWWFNRCLRVLEKCAGFALLVGEAWVLGKFSHRSISLFTVWMVGLPIVASLIVLWL